MTRFVVQDIVVIQGYVRQGVVDFQESYKGGSVLFRKLCWGCLWLSACCIRVGTIFTGIVVVVVVVVKKVKQALWSVRCRGGRIIRT